MVYVVVVVAIALALIFHFGPRYGHLNVVVYIAICSLIGGFSVLGCKAIGLAVKVNLCGFLRVYEFVVFYNLWIFFIYLFISCCFFVVVEGDVWIFGFYDLWTFVVSFGCLNLQLFMI